MACPPDNVDDLPKLTSSFIKPVVPAMEEVVKQPITPIQQPGTVARAMTFYAREKNPEDKIYIILYHLNDDEDSVSSKTFEVCIGRTAAYTDIREKLESGLDVDVHRSIVITETMQTETRTGDSKYYLIPYEECATVYSFCIAVADYFGRDEFDIEDYSEGDVPEDDRMRHVNDMNLTMEQREYRRIMEESYGRQQFINNMREYVRSKDSENNVV